MTPGQSKIRSAWWLRLLGTYWKPVAYCETVPPPVCVQDETCPPGNLSLRPGVRIAIDVGLARIGVASSDPAGLLASPADTVRRGRGDLGELRRIASEREAVE